MSRPALFLCAVGLAFSGCEGAPTQSITVMLPMGTATPLMLDTNSETELLFMAPGGFVELLIDCSPPEQPDTRGFVFSLSGSLSTPEPRAGYARLRQVVAAGPASVHMSGNSGPATCSVKLTSTPNACGALSVFRSSNVDHVHVDPGAEPRGDWETFPVSGNHYPAWASWNQDYVLPVRRGYLLHDLEHGGLVLSYRCLGALQSATCATVSTDLHNARVNLGQTRTLLTPDPTQPMLYGARAWRWGFLDDCYEAAEIADFMAKHFRHGREDLDFDAGPFDPTQ